jgi:ubiquinone/menaquinone biosynthesis C-methylase UbiE
MLLSPRDWHQRYLQQAGWTRAMRTFLLRRFEIGAGKRVLEVGCGTGAITSELSTTSSARVFGLDLNFPYLSLARENDSHSLYTAGDAFSLPFVSASFDAVYCHFFLLWIRNIPAMLAEIARVTHPGGMILALAEPDYGGRIDYPPELAQLGQWQQEALQRQGAATCTGRQLAAIFNHVGLKEIECGVLGGQWRSAPAGSEAETEWKVLLDDLGGQVSEAQLRPLRELDLQARQRGERILYVPTFYAYGQR